MRSSGILCAILCSIAIVACGQRDRGRRAPSRTPTLIAGASTSPQDDDIVAVDWRGRGQLYAGRVVARRDGLTRVAFADGDEEWFEPARIRPWPAIAAGRHLVAWLQSQPAPAQVIEARGTLLHVRIDVDGSDAWVSRDMLFLLDAPPGGGPVPAHAPPAFPTRRPIDPASVRIQVGDHVLAYWQENHAVPWLCEVLAVSGDHAHLRYSDESVGDVPLADVLRKVEGPAARGADRVWVMGPHPIARIVGTRDSFVELTTDDDHATWVPRDQVVASAPAVEPARLVPGALVTALWNGSPIHATVVARDGDQVVLQWHDASAPSPVPTTDVIETWEH